jgi:uncharacterized membrane protein YraQ (UPF0718 family)
MKEYLIKNKWSLLIFSAYLLFTSASFLLNIQVGKEIYETKFLPFMREMIVFLPAMFILIGLADTWISKEKVEKLIGEGSSLKGTLFVILLSMLQAGPLYGVFPVTYLLWKKGTSTRNIFIYIGTFSTVKLPLLMFETTFLGWKFSVVRFVVTLPIVILISLILEKYVKNKDFKVNEV